MKPARQELIDVVIPVYNEGNNILPLLRAFELEVKTPIRILICFDNDDDTTLEALSKFHGRLEVIPVKNEGKFAHGAVMTGFRFGDSPAVISYMADDDYNAGNIDEMVALYRNGCEIVCASRFVRGGSMVGCRWEKALIVRAVAWTLHYLGGLPCPDPTNAFRLVSRRLLEKVSIESTEGFTYSIELLAKCHRLGWKIAEVPVSWFERSQGVSRFRILQWAPAYLHWYFYVFATTYLFGRYPQTGGPN